MNVRSPQTGALPSRFVKWQHSQQGLSRGMLRPEELSFPLEGSRSQWMSHLLCDTGPVPEELRARTLLGKLSATSEAQATIKCSLSRSYPLPQQASKANSLWLMVKGS